MLMARPCGRRLQLDNRAPDAEPDSAAFMILSLGEFIDPPGGDDVGVLAVLADQQGGGAPDVDLRDHSVMVADLGAGSEKLRSAIIVRWSYDLAPFLSQPPAGLRAALIAHLLEQALTA